MERILQDFEIISSQIHTEFLTFFTQQKKKKKRKEEKIGKMETIINKTIKSPLENMFLQSTHTCKLKNIKTKLKS
jgi:hypothetical protein